jgi:acyl carrier protein
MDCDKGTLRGRLIDLVAHILDPTGALKSIPADARLTDIGMSSIKMVNLMLAVESEFAVTIPSAQITPENFHSIATIEALLNSLVA